MADPLSTSFVATRIGSAAAGSPSGRSGSVTCGRCVEIPGTRELAHSNLPAQPRLFSNQ